MAGSEEIPEVESGPEADASAAAAASPQRRRFSARFWILCAVIGVVVLAFGLPVALTATPESCTVCHEMQPYYDSWSTSSHRAAASNCLYCHAKPGVLNLAAYDLGFYREIVGHFTGAQVTSSTANEPSMDSCLQGACHSVNRETSNAGDIKINHRLHVIQAKIACMRCHPGAVHTGVGGRLKLPPMTLCKTCHADKMQQCNYCHSEERLQGIPQGFH